MCERRNCYRLFQCFVSVLFQGCVDGWNKTKFSFVSADHRKHCLILFDGSHIIRVAIDHSTQLLCVSLKPFSTYYFLFTHQALRIISYIKWPKTFPCNVTVFIAARLPYRNSHIKLTLREPDSRINVTFINICYLQWAEADIFITTAANCKQWNVTYQLTLSCTKFSECSDTYVFPFRPTTTC